MVPGLLYIKIVPVTINSTVSLIPKKHSTLSDGYKKTYEILCTHESRVHRNILLNWIQHASINIQMYLQTFSMYMFLSLLASSSMGTSRSWSSSHMLPGFVVSISDVDAITLFQAQNSRNFPNGPNRSLQQHSRIKAFNPTKRTPESSTAVQSLTRDSTSNLENTSVPLL